MSKPRKSRQSETDPVSHDRNAERAVIGALLFEPDAGVAALRALKFRPEWMYEEGHRAVIRAVFELADAGVGVDSLTVAATMSRAGTLDMIGGSGLYLARCAAEVPTVENIASYAEIVRDHARRRGAVEAVANARHKLQDAGADVAGVLAEAAAAIHGADDTADYEAMSPIPTGYDVGSDGAIWKEGRLKADGEMTAPVRVCPVVVRIARRGVDVGTGEHQVTLAWRTNGREYQITCARQVVSVSRMIVTLADHGLPVTSSTAAAMVDYLAAAEEECTLPVVRMARQCGWHGRAFLRGTHRHGADCPEWVKGDGIDSRVEAFTEAGSFDEWQRFVRPAVDEYPVLRFLLASVAVPPLLNVLGDTIDGFAVDVCSGAGSGKTSSTRVAFSFWGNPRRLGTTWDIKQVGAERAAAALNNLPLLHDDTKQAPDLKFAADMVYQIVSGTGRGRGKPDGMRRTATWRSCLWSTGEGPLNSGAAGAGGSRRRTLQVDALPWLTRSDSRGEYATMIEALACQHYGHGGRMLVDRLVSLSDDDRRAIRARWHEMHARYITRLRQQVTDQAAPVSAVAMYLASIQTGGEQIAAALGWEDREWIDDTLIRCIARALGEVDRARAALAHALGWMQQNPARVQGKEDKRELEPVTPSAGYIGHRTSKHVAFFPVALETELRRAGYDPSASVSTWHERGWMVCDPARRTLRVTYNGARSPMYSIRLDMVAELEGGAPTEDADQESLEID